MAQTYLQALASDARCFSCLTGQTKTQVQAYIVAFTTGLGVDPAAWATRAKCLNCLTTRELLWIRVYLLATLAGFTTNAASLVAAAACYTCFEHGEIATIQTYLLAQDPAGPGITDPKALGQVVSGFRKFSLKTLLQIEVFALATNAGVSTDPGSLMTAAKCTPCVPFPVLAAVALEVIDFLEPIPADSPRVSLPPPPPPPPPPGGPPPGKGNGTGGCTDTIANLTPVITAHYVAGVITTIDILIPRTCCKKGSFELFGSNSADMSGAVLITGGSTPNKTTNWTINGNNVSPPAFSFYAAQSVCVGGLTSPFSNVVPSVNSGDTWAQRVVLNGGPMPSAPTISAINTFVASLNSAGVWSKMLHVNVVAPDSLIAAETPLLKTIGTNDPYVVGAGNPSISINGLRFNPVVGWFVPGIIPSVDLPSDTDAGFSVYTSNGIDVNRYECGTIMVVPQAGIGMRWSFLGHTTGFCWNIGAGITIAGAPINGFHSQSRLSSTNLRFYRASSTHPFAQDGQDLALETVSRPTIDFNFWGGNIDGVSSNTSDTISFIALHHGLTAAETQSLYNAVQALRTSFGGGFV